jgi:hypothetical protein
MIDFRRFGFHPSRLPLSSSPLPTFSSSLSSLSSRTVFSSRAAGVDVHEADALGGLSLTDEGLIRREALVLDTVVGRGIPIAGFVGGGYDADTLVPIRPRSRGERRSSRTLPGVSLRPPLAFKPRPRRLSTPLLTPFNSTRLHPGTTRTSPRSRAGTRCCTTSRGRFTRATGCEREECASRHHSRS